MPKEIIIGLCLFVLFEGLALFAAPAAWQRMASELAALPPSKLRIVGAITMAVGLIGLHLVLS